MKLLNALIVVAAIDSVHAYFRMECSARTGLAILDPIVSPGGFSSHAHAVHGSSGKSGPCGFSVTLAYSVLTIIPQVSPRCRSQTIFWLTVVRRAESDKTNLHTGIPLFILRMQVLASMS